MLRPIVDLLLHKVHLLLAAAPCPARGRTKTNSNYDHDEKDDSDDNIDDGGGGEGQRIRILYRQCLTVNDTWCWAPVVEAVFFSCEVYLHLSFESTPKDSSGRLWLEQNGIHSLQATIIYRRLWLTLVDTVNDRESGGKQSTY